MRRRLRDREERGGGVGGGREKEEREREREREGEILQIICQPLHKFANVAESQISGCIRVSKILDE